MKTLKTWAAAAGLVSLTGAAQAALISLADGTVKDTNTNLIWLQNWNVNGAQNWSTQKNWAENLTLAGSSDWALPSLGEYVALFQAYGNLTQVSEFTNVQISRYWSGTENLSGIDAWRFATVFGNQDLALENSAWFAVAVRPGDVAAPVPEPQTLALALLALGAGMLAPKRRPR
jgi:hypothetical protein